jgi:serine/threonine protein kinase/class 3 adenylate cyclase
MDLGPYALVAQIGAGRDGSSFSARDTRSGESVELWLLDRARSDPGRWGDLVRRLRRAALLDHPASRRPIQLQLDEDVPYAVLSRFEGRTLDLADRPGLIGEVGKVVDLGRELASSLAEAHRLGIVHERIGPTEIGLTEAGRPSIDFTGVFVRPEPEEGPNSPSWRFVSPEIRQGHPPSQPSDIFSLGESLRWLLGESGTVEVCADETVEWAADQREASDSRAALDILLTSMCAPEPSARPTAREVEDALARLDLGHGEVTTWGDATMGDSPEFDDRTIATESTLRDSSPRASVASPPRRSPARTLADLGPGSWIGRFRLLERLGQGGMGQVFRAEDGADGTTVAIKILRPDFAARGDAFRRFHKEARLLAEVLSPHVANLLEVNEDGAVHFLVLEYVPGRSLGRYLAERGPLDEATALSVASDVARALADAHARGIVHRDIKPENILVVEGDPSLESASTSETVEYERLRVKLSDFGLARHVVESESLRLTAENAYVGTPHYMSPEQCSGRPVDARSDVYSLGATLFHMLAGRPPFQGASLVEVIGKHNHEPPPALRSVAPHVSDGVAGLIARALAKDPRDRFADASAMLEEIERLIRGEPARIAAHPVLPGADPSKVLAFDFTWELRASARQLWPLVSNTERLNHAIGLPAALFSTRPDPVDGRVRRLAESSQGGLDAVWEEHPYEWIEPNRIGVLREYSRGPFKWMTSAVELAPGPGGGTVLTHRVRIEPRGALFGAAARFLVGRGTRKALERVYRRIDEWLVGSQPGGLVDPFEEVPTLAAARRQKLDERLDALSRRGIHPGVVDSLGEFLASAAPQDLARIRPLAIARRLGLDPDQVVSACLHGAREGLFVLLWDILCPLCRIPSEVQDTLRALKEHGRCEACNLDFELDFARSVELVFRAHPEIRDVEMGVYCIGGPSHSPHVAAQVRVAPGETFALELGLSEGAYRLRGPQLGYTFDFRVEPAVGVGRLDLDLARGPGPESPRELHAGAQALRLSNPTDRELVARIERVAPRADALTAARASALALFRDLFPGEVLSPGQLVSIAATTLLLAEPEDAGRIYERLGDARAFVILHEQFQVIDRRIRREGGALVKTVGDGIVAAFPDAASAVRAALDLPADLASAAETRDLRLRIAVHRGPAMAATFNGHLDYFGITVTQASGALGYAEAGEVVLSQAVAGEPAVAVILQARGLENRVFRADLPGQPEALLHRVGVGA